MNSWFCFVVLCFCLFSCDETTKGQSSSKKKNPKNDREKAGLKGAVKFAISMSPEKDSSILAFDSLGRLIKEGDFYGKKGFSGKVYIFDSLGNSLKNLWRT